MSIAIIQATVGGAPDTIDYDGKWHRFKLDNSKRKDTGWYVAHLFNGFPVIVFGDWRNPGQKYKIVGEQLADEVSSNYSYFDKAAEDQKKKERAESTASLAGRLWPMGKPCETTSYLTRKLIKPHGGKILYLAASLPGWFHKFASKHSILGAFMVPVYKSGRIVDLQFIKDASKIFLPHGDHRGGHYVLGDMTDHRVVVATGFATAASIRECTGLTTICCFSDGNIDAVVSEIFRNSPNKEIIIAADNDIRHDNKRVINSGMVYSTAAAKRHNCLLAVPEFNHQKVDFNDIHVLLGQQAVIEQIGLATNPRLKTVEISASKASELLALAIEDWLDSKDDIGVKAPAGLGKSTKILTSICTRKLRCDYFVPSYALAMEQAARLPEGQAVAIRGRTHQTETIAPLCAKSEAAQYLEKCGLAHQTMRLLCGTVDRDTGCRPCPYAGNCGYLQQFRSQAPIRFFAHEYLSLDNNRLSKRDIDVAVIDETFRDSLEKVRRWSMGELMEQPETIYRNLANAIVENRLLSMSHTVSEIDRILDEATEIESHIYPEMDASTVVKKVKPLLEARRKPTTFLWNCKKAMELNEANRLWFKNMDGGSIFAAWVKPIQFIPKGTPTAFLDASLVDSIIKKVSPGCRIVKIEATRQAHITQITDSGLSHTRLKNDVDYLSSRLLEFIHRQAKQNPNGAVIAPKFWIEAHGDRIPAEVKTAHFGALRGLNTLEECDWLVQIGRIQPATYAVEEIVRAWFPNTRLTLNGAYIQQQQELSSKNDVSAIVWTYTHADPRCREVLESIREQESLQAIDRLRLIHGKAKRIWLFSNVPLPGVQPDELATLDGLTLPGRLAEVALRDSVVVTGRKELYQRHPDVFPTEKSVKEYLEDVAVTNLLNGSDSNKTLNRDRAIYHKGYTGEEATVKNHIICPTVNYRLDGQPGKARTAIIPNGDDEALVKRLESIHGKPVTLVDRPNPARPTKFRLTCTWNDIGRLITRCENPHPNATRTGCGCCGAMKPASLTEVRL